ncbi:MAG TPA: leucine-rich repeat protein [Clostridia bacterium]|nr:leucine-rich repeat protein [Clostridia bacterium]
MSLKLCVLSLLVSMVATVVQAQFLYSTNVDSITINSYTGEGGAVIIPHSIDGLPVKTIGRNAFRESPTLTSIVIPTSVTDIKSCAFYGCTGLESVTIPDSVTNLEAEVFASCTSMTNAIIGKNIKSILELMFHNCVNLTSVTLGRNVTNIGLYAFDFCTNLQSVILPDGLISIEMDAFARSALTSITIPETVTHIGGRAFANCCQLSNVVISEGLSAIDPLTFANCSSLTNLAIPASVTSLGGPAFSLCTNLTRIVVDGLNPAYSSVDGVLFDKYQTTLIQYPGNRPGTSYTIPDSVCRVGRQAFIASTNLTSIFVPNNVNLLEALAFSYCGRLTNIVVGSGLATIQDAAFYECKNLRGIYFWGKAPSLQGYMAFWKCASATAFYLPGTSGWGQSYGGLPTALWQLPYPVILNGCGTDGTQNNRFNFIVSWAGITSVVVEASSSLAHPVWLPVGTNILIEGCSLFSDTERANWPVRFYRVRSP